MARSRAPKHSTEATRRIIELARDQHGVFSTAQLELAGISWDSVRSRYEAGWLRRLHPGVYCLSGQVLSHRGRWLAAVLAAGSGAVLSHRDAAGLWRILLPSNSHPIHVSVPARNGRKRRKGLVVHRPRTLPDDELTIHDSIPVTTPERTILDLAAVVPRRRLERAIDEAEYLRLCTTTRRGRFSSATAGAPGRGSSGRFSALTSPAPPAPARIWRKGSWRSAANTGCRNRS